MQISRFAGALSLAALLAFVPLSASAATFMHPEKGQQSLVLSSGDTFKNLYVAGNALSINSKTDGDLFAAGNNVMVSGPISADATIAASAITVSAPVGGDARIAAGDINISAPISGDALLAAGRIVITDKASVSGDAYFGAGDILVDGALAGKTKLSGENVTINGPVTGNLMVYAQNLTFGKNAKVTGTVAYFGPKEAMVTEGATVPAIAFEMVKSPMGRKSENPQNSPAFLGFLSALLVIKLVAWCIVAFMLYKLFPRTAEHLVTKVQTKFWSMAGIGFLGLIVVPVAVLILLITAVGYSAALLALVTYVLFMFLATPLVVLTVGGWIYGKLAKKPTTTLGWQAVLIGVPVVVLVKFIPILGGLAVFLVTCAAFGALLKKLFWLSKQQQTPPTETIVVEEVTVTTV